MLFDLNRFYPFFEPNRYLMSVLVTCFIILIMSNKLTYLSEFNFLLAGLFSVLLIAYIFVAAIHLMCVRKRLVLNTILAAFSFVAVFSFLASL